MVGTIDYFSYGEKTFFVMQNIFIVAAMQHLSLHEKEPVGRTFFHKNGFTQRLALTVRQKASWK